MKILITGAGGLLGSHAVKQLIGSNEIHALVHSAPVEAVPDVVYHVVDLAGSDGLGQLPDEIDAVIHLAQSARFREFPDQAADVFNVNVASTARLLEYARRSRARAFILASSGGVYGTGDKAFKENAVIPQHGQLGYYLGSKLCAEVLAQNYASLLNVSVLRFFFIYGRGQKRSMLLPRLVDNIRAGVPITLQGQDGIRISPIHVSDAALALESCLQLTGSHTFNIAGNEILTMREIAETIGRAVGREPVFQSDSVEPRHLIANIDAMKVALTVPKVRLAQGIGELLLP
jgi:nucleoside-diphosphate-sugar epimerase